MIRWLLMLWISITLWGCEEQTVNRLLDENPNYAGKPDEHAMPAAERRKLLRERLLKVQTDR